MCQKMKLFENLFFVCILSSVIGGVIHCEEIGDDEGRFFFFFFTNFNLMKQFFFAIDDKQSHHHQCSPSSMSCFFCVDLEFSSFFLEFLACTTREIELY